METAAARQLTNRVLDWLPAFEGGRVLHVFDRSANLVNDRGEVLSIVDPEIGPGPFNLVLKETFDFMGHISPASEIGIGSGTLWVGTAAIRLEEAVIWNPIPPWRSIHAEILPDLIETIREEMDAAPVKPAIDFDPPPDPNNRVALAAFAGRLAGLGPGLTPSGDDVLVGLIHAYFVRFPEFEVDAPSSLVAKVAAPLTTTLSAAWLIAAANGEAGHLWHRLIETARTGDEPGLRRSIRRILATGHTSGADALAGFRAGLS